MRFENMSWMKEWVEKDSKRRKTTNLDVPEGIYEKVLFICTRNSSRSQMAEGLINHDLAGKFEAFSAGTEPSFVNPWQL